MTGRWRWRRLAAEKSCWSAQHHIGHQGIFMICLIGIIGILQLMIKVVKCNLTGWMFPGELHNYVWQMRFWYLLTAQQCDGYQGIWMISLGSVINILQLLIIVVKGNLTGWLFPGGEISVLSEESTSMSGSWRYLISARCSALQWLPRYLYDKSWQCYWHSVTFDKLSNAI